MQEGEEYCVNAPAAVALEAEADEASREDDVARQGQPPAQKPVEPVLGPAQKPVKPAVAPAPPAAAPTKRAADPEGGEQGKMIPLHVLRPVSP